MRLPRLSTLRALGGRLMRRPPPALSPHCALFLDIDGTLLELAERPEAARPDRAVSELLPALGRALDGAFALVTGRAISDVDRLFPGLAMPVAGQHGAERRSAHGTVHIHAPKGLLAIQYEGNIEDLRKHIDACHPLIVLVGYGFSFTQTNHFMVIIGYNDHGFIVNSGKDKEKFISEMDFLKSWERTKFWTLLIKPDE